MLLGFTRLDFLPQWSVATLAVALVTIAVLAALARWASGPAAQISRHGGLWIVRGITALVLALILFNPVKVDRTKGAVDKPDVFVLMDASSSMKMGSPESRWDLAHKWLAQAESALGVAMPARLRTFFFGRALTTQLAAKDSPANEKTSTSQTSTSQKLEPNEGDTRIVTALRQAPNRFGRKPPQALVLMSDGRARDEVGLDALLAQYKQWNIPIHVAPMGEEGKGGDVAIVAAVMPAKARKSSEVEAHVFLRSYGFEGKRATVTISSRDDQGELRELTSAPVTLEAGFQAATLRFQSGTQKTALEIKVSSQPDEVSESNNKFEALLDIDRTKIRVLYVEGNARSFRQVVQADRTEYRGPYSELHQALSSDEDIECVVVMAQPGSSRTIRIDTLNNSAQATRGFPETAAELSAFDCIILSNVDRNVLTDKQLGWLKRWIGARGGGLMMVGGERSFSAGGWADSPVSEMLPVELAEGVNDWRDDIEALVRPDPAVANHPLWRILGDANQNQTVIDAMPAYRGVNRWAGVKPGIAKVLAESSSQRVTVPRQPSTVELLVPNAKGKKIADPKLPPSSNSQEPTAALVLGRYGKGRTAAFAPAITTPWADDVNTNWGRGDNRYYAKFWRNVVYWLTEDSSIGRRRLVARCDKRFYRPGESITIAVGAYDENANPTRDYRVTANVEQPTTSISPNSPPPSDPNSIFAPVRWPEDVERTSGETGPFVAWGEEFDLHVSANDDDLKSERVYHVTLPLVEQLSSGSASQRIRLELTAAEDQTQVDSTSMEIHILHDPFEQHNPFPNHELLKTIAQKTGGKVLSSPSELAKVLGDIPVEYGPDEIRKTPVWSTPWLLLAVLALMTLEWVWRRAIGLA